MQTATHAAVGIEQIIAPIRPTLKADCHAVEFDDDYIKWTPEDGDRATLGERNVWYLHLLNGQGGES